MTQPSPSPALTDEDQALRFGACAHCGRPLTEEERHYYGTACDRCESEMHFAMQNDRDPVLPPRETEEDRHRAEIIVLRARATAAEAALLEKDGEIARLRALPSIEFHQQDWIPGFAAFLPGSTTPQPESRAFCVLNLGSMLSTVAHGDVPAADLPGFIVESMIHEVGHVLEQWAGVEFSEERVEALCDQYRAALAPTEPLPARDDEASR